MGHTKTPVKRNGLIVHERGLFSLRKCKIEPTRWNLIDPCKMERGIVRKWFFFYMIFFSMNDVTLHFLLFYSRKVSYTVSYKDALMTYFFILSHLFTISTDSARDNLEDNIGLFLLWTSSQPPSWTFFLLFQNRERKFKPLIWSFIYWRSTWATIIYFYLPYNEQGVQHIQSVEFSEDSHILLKQKIYDRILSLLPAVLSDSFSKKRMFFRDNMSQNILFIRSFHRKYPSFLYFSFFGQCQGPREGSYSGLFRN